MNEIMKLMNDSQKKKDYLICGHNWAKTLDINILKNKWMALFTSK